jgi:molecular chaperone DnaK
MDEKAILAVLFARARAIGIEPEADPMVRDRIGSAARKAAVELTESRETTVNLPFLAATSAGPLHLEVRLPSDAHGVVSGPILDPRVKLT